MSRLFRQSSRPSADPQASSEVTAVENDGAEGHTEVAESVADYMEHLLGRVRTRQADRDTIEGQTPESPSRAWEMADDGVLTAGAPQGSGIPAAALLEAHSVASRRGRNVDEMRAGVDSLREIANHSARSAVALHTSRKLRRSMAVTLPLAIISFVLAGALFVIGGENVRIYSQAFGTVMLGVIVMIELAHSFWKIKSASGRSRSSDNQQRPDAPLADPEADAEPAPSPAAS
jgi:hypothetical protein